MRTCFERCRSAFMRDYISRPKAAPVTFFISGENGDVLLEPSPFPFGFPSGVTPSLRRAAWLHRLHALVGHSICPLSKSDMPVADDRQACQ